MRSLMAVGAVCLCLPGTAAAADGWHLLARSYVFTDGVRYAATQPSDDLSVTRVYDTVTGRSFSTPTPAPCGTPFELKDVGGGQLLWQGKRCEKPWLTAVLFDIARRELPRPAGSSHTASRLYAYVYEPKTRTFARYVRRFSPR